jgi:hypothetical protein
MGLVWLVRVGKMLKVTVVVLKLWWFFLFGIHLEVVEFLCNCCQRIALFYVWRVVWLFEFVVVAMTHIVTIKGKGDDKLKVNVIVSFFVCVFLHLILYIHKTLDLPIVLQVFINLQLRFVVLKCLMESFMCSSCGSMYHCNKRKRWQWTRNKCEIFLLCFNFLNGGIDFVSSTLHCFLCSWLHNLCNLVTLFTFFLCLIFAYKYGTCV